MKKSKILTPILAVAGLGATVAPMVVMTSCGHPAIEKTLTYDSTNDVFKYQEDSGNTLPAGKYKFTTNYGVQGQIYFKFYAANSKIIEMDEDFCKNIKIVFAPKGENYTLKFNEDFWLESDGYIKIDQTGGRFSQNMMSFEFELKGNYAGSINTIKFEK